jgi:tetratricopeptide (TPR) repeat protein
MTDLIGLANLSQMYYNRGVYYDTLRDYNNMEKAFLEAIKFNHTQAMNRLGLYYDDTSNEEQMLKYYLLAIDLEDTAAMYNLARYYNDIKDYDNMKKYYLLAIEYKDTDCCYELSLYYHDLKDYDNMKKYYILATEFELELEKNLIINKNAVNNGFNDFNPFVLINMLETIENLNSNLKEKFEKLSRNKEIVIYHNKIRISKELNHVDDCIICYENKLHINIYCGHCFCIDCYPSLFDKSCPLCRISKNSCAFV